jgi:hypothetical protein
MESEIEKQEEKDFTGGATTQAHHGSTLLNTESDLVEASEDMPDDEEPEQVDYSQYSKEDFLKLVKELVKENDLKRVDGVLRDIKPLVDEIRVRERTAALNRFILDGGSPDDFEYRVDDLLQEYDTTVKLLKDKRAQSIRTQEEQKNENLKKKQELLERLRELVDAQGASNQFDLFKEIQNSWKVVGAVPGTQAKALWANYHALVDRFYDNQSIYFELKELDRKRNLEAKNELCIRAEKLIEAENIKEAIRELNELHNEFKHIGPVPQEEKEATWQRFKAASDAIYARRDEFVKNVQQELHANLAQKEVLCNEVENFIPFHSDRIKEWNQKTKEILELQKKWETIGGLPRAKSKEVNKRFWTAFKTFFNNKNVFFKKLDEERDTNLQKKNALIQKAIELKESTDWDKTSRELKSLQQQWKDIGPVPEKLRDKVFKEFKEACDYFFEHRRGHKGQLENDQVENLKQKEAIVEELERHVVENSATAEILRALEERFGQIGFVPKKDIGTIRNRYHEAVQKFTQAIQGISDGERSQLVLESQLADLKNDPMAGQKLYQKEQAVRKKIMKIENDIAVWKNNLEFFGRSKNAEKYKEEFHAKIDEATEHLRQLKEQLKLLRTVS